jgi:hypothetical protein
MFCTCICACVDPSGICECGLFINQRAVDEAREVGYLSEATIEGYLAGKWRVTDDELQAAYELRDSVGQSTELPGMWDTSDLVGGETDCDEPNECRWCGKAVYSDSDVCLACRS